MVKRTERGWGGHYVYSNRCRFRRNTLIENGKDKIVVSTVGLMEHRNKEGEFETIGYQMYYETRAFQAKLDSNYMDADVTKEISFKSPWSISEFSDNSDNIANDMHETIVEELIQNMEKL